MNTQQQTDLTPWLQNQEQPLPESLKMAFVDRALEEIRSQYPKSVFNGTEFENIAESNSLLSLSDAEAIYYIQTLLSQIDGKAVLPFLEVEVQPDFEFGTIRKIQNILILPRYFRVFVSFAKP